MVYHADPKSSHPDKLVRKLGGGKKSLVMQAEDLKSAHGPTEAKRFIAIKTPFSDGDHSWENEMEILSELKKTDADK